MCDACKTKVQPKQTDALTEDSVLRLKSFGYISSDNKRQPQTLDRNICQIPFQILDHVARMRLAIYVGCHLGAQAFSPHVTFDNNS